MNFEERYGTIDRLLHRTAFQLGTAQQALSDVETMLFRDTLDAIPLDDPVFITALPRSGTTILLKLLWNTERFASHTYQDMPFVLCPMLWARFSRQFATDDSSRERAHGDGLQVSGKSPEAFEEMIWKHFWSAHYRADHIQPWRSGEQHAEFESFFQTHMRKVIAVRQEDPQDGLRYLSKNNLNIARLAAPPAPLREGTFLIPFRHPVQQAASMLRQHRRFTALHEEDDFVREYMEAIGHHEFGKGLRPVNFDDWLDDAPPPTTLSFWLQYWIAAYRFVLAHADSSTVLLPYDRLTEDPASTLPGLANALDLSSSALTQQADRLHPPRAHSVDQTDVADSVLRQATEVYNRLDQQSPL